MGSLEMDYFVNKVKYKNFSKLKKITSNGLEGFKFSEFIFPSEFSFKLVSFIRRRAPTG